MSSIHAYTLGNKILLNDISSAILNKENIYFDQQQKDTVQGIIGHEIGHINHNHLYKLNAAYAFTTFSSLALIPVFNAIKNDDTSLVRKMGSIAAISAAKCLSDTLYTSFFSRQLEKQADNYTIQYSNVNQLKGLSSFFNKLAEKESPHNHFIHIIGAHPAHSKRALLFKNAAKDLEHQEMKLYLKETVKPPLVHTKCISSLDNID